MRGVGRWLRTSRGAMLAVLTSMLAISCTVGPAANHAARLAAPEGNIEPTGDADDPSSGTPQLPDEEPTSTPSPPTLDPADAEGRAAVAAALNQQPADLGSVCCTVKLPDGSFLVGYTDSWSISLVSPDGNVSSAGKVQNASLVDQELGVLGLAVPPDATMDNLHVYVYLANSPSSWVASYSYDAEAPPGEQLIASGSPLIKDIPRGEANNGGALAFGPDGNLYVGTGDTGQATLPADPSSLAGKILRSEPDGAIPSDNPDPSSYVYSSGFANIEGLAWDPAGRLWVADAGSGTLSVVTRDPQDGTVSPPVEVWRVPDGEEPTGLAYGPDSRSLWLGTSTSDGVYRIPLDGEGGLANGDAGPELLTAPDLPSLTDVVPGPDDATLHALTTDGGLLDLTVS